MTRRAPLKSSDLRGAVRLVTDATAGLTDLVEAMHERIARVPGSGAPAQDGRTGGISGLVYKTIRGVTRLVGGSIEALLKLLTPQLGADDSNPEREAVVAALNGVLGDYLAATANPLATPMTLCSQGRPLLLQSSDLTTRLPQANGRVLLLLHGLCMNDRQWSRAGHDHGAALARDLAFTPVYARYNSGLHVSINGRALAQQIEQLLGQWPQPVQRLVLLCHSMGGLLARSAVHYGLQAGHRWPAHLSDIVFLGTPHHGAPLERAGNWVDVALGAAPYAAPFARLGKVRSAGIMDLRHGRVRPLAAGSRADDAPAPEASLPLPEGPRCHAIAGCLGTSSKSLKARLAGDGLVPVDSALGQHPDPARALHFAPDRQWVAQGVNHMALLSDAGVYAQIAAWLRPPGGGPTGSA